MVLQLGTPTNVSYEIITHIGPPGIILLIEVFSECTVAAPRRLDVTKSYRRRRRLAKWIHPAVAAVATAQSPCLRANLNDTLPPQLANPPPLT